MRITLKNKLAKQIAQKYCIETNTIAFKALMEFSFLSEQGARKQIRSLSRQYSKNSRSLLRECKELRQEKKNDFWGDHSNF
jgi:hypothetical protein